jgi:hypothetical protein
MRGANTFVELFDGRVFAIEPVVVGIGGSRCVGSRIAARLVQLRNQLEPNGDVVASVVRLEMGVLLLLSSFWKMSFVRRRQQQLHSGSFSLTPKREKKREKSGWTTDLYHCSSWALGTTYSPLF